MSDIVKYKVLSESGVTVLRKKELAEKEIRAKIKDKKDKVKPLEEIYPVHMIQKEYINVVVTKGMILSTDEYEPNRLYSLCSNGVLEVMDGKARPTKDNKINGGKPVPGIDGEPTTEDLERRRLKAETEKKEAEAEEAKKKAGKK